MPEMTPEQAEAACAFLKGLVGVLSGEHRECLHCKQPVDRFEKIGRSVYAYPCGCRQYQGDVPERDKVKKK